MMQEKKNVCSHAIKIIFLQDIIEGKLRFIIYILFIEWNLLLLIAYSYLYSYTKIQVESKQEYRSRTEVIDAH